MSLTNQKIEMEALKTEREGMLAENWELARCGARGIYDEKSFKHLAERIRALKQPEVQSEEPSIQEILNSLDKGALVIAKRNVATLKARIAELEKAPRVTKRLRYAIEMVCDMLQPEAILRDSPKTQHVWARIKLLEAALAEAEKGTGESELAKAEGREG